MVLMERWMAWLERPFLPWLERRIKATRCGAQFGNSNRSCELQVGHEGPHKSLTISWNYDTRK
jgi:hypothetical protein